NGFGKLDIGSQNDQSQAVAVAGLGASNLQLTGVSDVALGIDHSCAVLDTGNVVCWGGNFLYELGADPPVPGANDNFSTRPIAATKVNELLLIHGRVTAMGAGRNQSTCVVTEQGKGICWGFDRYNQTGHGEVPLNDALRAPDLVTEVGDRFSPATELSEIQVGQFSACARKQSGRLMCWGYGLHGDVGNGVDLRFTPLPAQLGSKDSYHTAQWVVTPGFGAGGPPLEGVRALAEGEGDHQCAVLDDARGVCWGYNADGRLGNGKSGSFPFGTGTVVEAEATPTYVAGLDGAEHLTGIVQMTRGFAHTCALLDTGHVACWGQGDFGRLGNGSTEVQARPVRVAFPGGPAAQ
ncbi:MAG: RCC1 domain-containing protein, partial [Polyangiales bacterium]